MGGRRKKDLPNTTGTSLRASPNITSGSGGGRREKGQHNWHLARRPTSPVQALVAAYAANKTIVDQSSARAAVTEVTTD